MCCWHFLDVNQITFVKRCKKNKKANHKWAENTPNSDLLRDCLPVNQAQLYHVTICLCCAWLFTLFTCYLKLRVVYCIY